MYFSHGFLKAYFWPLSSADLKNLLCFLCGYKPKARQSESAYSKTLIWDYEPFINLSSVILWEPRFRIQWIFHTFISYAISGAQKCVLLGIILHGLFLCVCVSHHVCVFWGISVWHFIWSQYWNVCVLLNACFYTWFLCCKGMFCAVSWHSNDINKKHYYPFWVKTRRESSGHSWDKNAKLLSINRSSLGTHTCSLTVTVNQYSIQNLLNQL